MRRAGRRRSAWPRWTGFVANTSAIGNSGSLFGEFEGGPLGFGEHRRLSPSGDQVDSHRAFPGMLGVLGVHVQADAAAIDLAGSDLDQLLGAVGKVEPVTTAPAELM